MAYTDNKYWYIVRSGTNIRACGHDKEPVQLDLHSREAPSILDQYAQLLRGPVEAIRVDKYHLTFTAAVARAKTAALRAAEEEVAA